MIGEGNEGKKEKWRKKMKGRKMTGEGNEGKKEKWREKMKSRKIRGESSGKGWEEVMKKTCDGWKRRLKY